MFICSITSVVLIWLVCNLTVFYPLQMAQEADSRSEGSVKAIVIPPPRPKRKPAHPYPRKSPVPYTQSPPPNLSAMEKGTKSPTSVLSSFGSEDQVNRCSSPNSCTSDIQSIGATSID